MPKVSEDHLAARRAQILDGARRCFAEHGYEGATVRRLEEAIGHLPSAPLSGDLARAVSTGKPLNWNDISPDPAPAGMVCLLAPGGRLVALAEVDPTSRVRYRRVFANP